MYWLLEKSVLDAINAADLAKIKPTDEQNNQFLARMFSEEDSGNSRLLSIVGDKARITIEGVLTNEPNFMAFLFGGGNTTYPDIMKALDLAEGNPKVKAIDYFYASPGGHIEGLYNTIQRMQAVKKPQTAYIRKAASAAYALAANSGKMIAENPMAQVGSLGIVVKAFVDKSVIEITSSNAPKKRPDPTTPEGLSVIKEELDAVESIFFEMIAAGRGVTTEKIIANFGQGATFLAGDALKRGMIDEIDSKAKLSVVPKPAAKSGNTKGVQTMDLIELKAQHPAVYAEAVKDGVLQERDRVNAHLTMGKSFASMDLAIQAIEAGDPMTHLATAKYISAGQNRGDIEKRADDDKKTDAALKGIDPTKKGETGDKAGQQVVSVALAELGVNLTAGE